MITVTMIVEYMVIITFYMFEEVPTPRLFTVSNDRSSFTYLV
ncbi:hypothetical protein [Methanococcus voltae]|nr:hypothetical protein [Methanococcus voltae]